MAIIVFIAAFLSAGCTKGHSKGKDMSLLQKKPVFQLKVNASGARYYIEVNGVSIFSELHSKSQVSVTLPVNHWMRSGGNTIGFIVYPNKKGMPFNPHGSIEIALTVREFSDRDNVYNVATLHFSGKQDESQSHAGKSSPSGTYASIRGFELNESGDIQVFDPVGTPRSGFEGAIRFERKINMPSSLPLWAFFNSDNIPDYASIEDDDDFFKAIEPLFAVYEQIHKALINKNIESILPLFEERNRETDMAFYLEPGTTAAGIRKDLLETINDINDKNLEPVNLTIRSISCIAEENQKLTSLLRQGQRSAISLNYVNEKEGMGSVRFPMYFRLQDGKWILTR